MQRFARYWDMFANSGRFQAQMKQLLSGAPFANMMAFADWLYASTDATHRLSLLRQEQLLKQYLAQVKGIAIENDKPDYAPDHAPNHSPNHAPKHSSLPRQTRHLSSSVKQ
jgi:hypothetical protein